MGVGKDSKKNALEALSLGMGLGGPLETRHSHVFLAEFGHVGHIVRP